MWVKLVDAMVGHLPDHDCLAYASQIILYSCMYVVILMYIAKIRVFVPHLQEKTTSSHLAKSAMENYIISYTGLLHLILQKFNCKYIT